MKQILLWGVLSLTSLYHTVPCKTTTSITVKKVLGGIITIEEMILNVTLDDPTNQISIVSVYNEKGLLVQQNDGCGSFSCSYNVGNLDAGLYEVIVRTTNGESFSDYVTID